MQEKSSKKVTKELHLFFRTDMRESLKAKTKLFSAFRKSMKRSIPKRTYVPFLKGHIRLFVFLLGLTLRFPGFPSHFLEWNEKRKEPFPTACPSNISKKDKSLVLLSSSRLFRISFVTNLYVLLFGNV